MLVLLLPLDVSFALVFLETPSYSFLSPCEFLLCLPILSVVVKAGEIPQLSASEIFGSLIPCLLHSQLEPECLADCEIGNS